MNAHERTKVLVIDDDATARRAIERYLGEAGYAPLLAAHGTEGVRIATQNAVSLVLLDFILPGPDGLKILRHLRSDPRTRGIPVVMMTALEGEQSLSRAFAAGADDFLRKPVSRLELLARVKSQLQLRAYVEELASKERDAQVVVDLTRTLSSSLDFREILRVVVRQIAQVARVHRVSLVLTPDHDGDDVGYLVAASDDEFSSNTPIALRDFPEIQKAVSTSTVVEIELRDTPLSSQARDLLFAGETGRVTLLPVVWENSALGVLTLRAAADRPALGERELAFCRIVANAMAVALRNARIMQSLRDQTRQVTVARDAAERRLEALMHALSRYTNLFDSAAYGIAAASPDGTLLLANLRAYDLLGYGDDELRGSELRKLVHPEDAAKVTEAWSGLAHAESPLGAALDVRVVRRDGSTRVFNVSLSKLIDSEGAVIVMFRDVTDERATAAELVKTKEFLESLIDASVDGIVAADMKGSILLFNKGAERIYGYRSSDVVGTLNVRQLYPDGMAEEIMRRIRSSGHGGEGRLQSMRLDAVDAKGQLIPISLSAAMIFENGVPAATFGIFTDLRERLHVEERLAQAQQKLAVSEKQILIAELAGTAAHELNQPLTSVMGYAELLKRRLAAGTAEAHGAEMIVQEAERMADIVRKIGNITKYETKSYVGQQKILDLERASGSSTDDPSVTERRSNVEELK